MPTSSTNPVRPGAVSRRSTSAAHRRLVIASASSWRATSPEQSGKGPAQPRNSAVGTPSRPLARMASRGPSPTAVVAARVHGAAPLPEDLAELGGQPGQIVGPLVGPPAGEQGEPGGGAAVDQGPGRPDEPVERGRVDLGEPRASPAGRGLHHAVRRSEGAGHRPTLLVEGEDRGGVEPSERRGDHVAVHVTEHAATPGDVEGERVRPAPLGGEGGRPPSEVDGRADVVDGVKGGQDGVLGAQVGHPAIVAGTGPSCRVVGPRAPAGPRSRRPALPELLVRRN